MADPCKKLSVNELINITNGSGTLSLEDSVDRYDVNTLNAESDNETIDKLEVNQLYDSDNEKYVPSPDNKSDEEKEERDAVGSMRKRRKVFTSTPIKGTASTCTSAAAPASILLLVIDKT